MHRTLRLLASVSRSTSSALYSEPGLPTGLTGIVTHAAPRSTLLYLYSSTLDKLRTFPEHSVYRQSTEALTRHRMSIIESIKPPGLEEWQQRVSNLVDEHPDAFKKVKVIEGEGYNIVYRPPPPEKSFNSEDDAVNAAYKARPVPNGPQFEDEPQTQRLGPEMARDVLGEEQKKLRIEAEPPMTMEQVSEIEQKIGSGLIEEIIMVAEGEKQLADTMAEYKVWEDLEEKPQEGQWLYNERETS